MCISVAVLSLGLLFAVGECDKRPEIQISNVTFDIVAHYGVQGNRISKRTLGGVYYNGTLENTITNETLLDHDKIRKNKLSNGTLANDVPTPENRVTNGTLVHGDKTPDNSITNGTLVHGDKTPDISIINGTLVHDDKTPENSIINGTLLGDDKTPENAFTNGTLVDDGETPENRILNGTLADLSPDEAPENRIFNEPVVPVGQDERLENRIFYGNLAHSGQFPFFVYVSTGANDPRFCGGIMLTYVWVLTPAHCVLPAVFQNITVTAGIVSFDPSEKIESVRKVRKLLIHPEFVENPQGKFHYNVALLKLMSPFLASFEIRLSHLAAKNSWPDRHAEECFIIGWGMGIQNDSSKMNFQRIFVMGISQGTDTLEAFPQTLCTSSKAGLGPCMNDIGAPLWCQSAVVGLLVSTLNESAECGTDHVVHVYEFTGDHVEWISKVIEDLPTPINLMTGRSCAKPVEGTSNFICTILFLGSVYRLLKQTNRV